MIRAASKRLVALVLLLLLAAPLAGCWDRSEIDELGYILAIGIDTAPYGYTYTFWLGVPRKLVGTSGGSGGGEGSIHPLTIEAPDLTSAMNLVNTYIARRITLEHAKALIIGKDLAERDVLTALSPAVRFREFRRNMTLMVSETTAREYLEDNKPSIEENPARWIEMMATHQALSGFISKSRIHDFFLDSESQSALPLVVLTGLNTKSQVKDGGKQEKQSEAGGGSAPGGQGEAAQAKTPGGQQPAAVDGAYLPGTVPRIGGNPAETIGGAVFNGTKMVGTLTGAEVRLALMLRGEFERMYYAEPDPLFPGYFVGTDIRQSRNPKIQITYDGMRPIIDVTVSLEGDIVGIESLHDYTQPDQMVLLERAIADDLTKQLQAIIVRSQKEFGGDLFDFGDHARGQFLTWKEWTDYRWHQRFLEAKITPQVKFAFRRVGLQFTPPVSPVERIQPPPIQEKLEGKKGDQGQGGTAP